MNNLEIKHKEYIKIRDKLTKHLSDSQFMIGKDKIKIYFDVTNNWIVIKSTMGDVKIDSNDLPELFEIIDKLKERFK